MSDDQPARSQTTRDLPHLMKSLSYTPTDDRVPQALCNGAHEIERLRKEIDIRDAYIAGMGRFEHFKQTREEVLNAKS